MLTLKKKKVGRLHKFFDKGHPIIFGENTDICSSNFHISLQTLLFRGGGHVTEYSLIR